MFCNFFFLKILKIKIEDNYNSADDEEEFSDGSQSSLVSPQKASKISTSQLSGHLDSNLVSTKSTPKHSKDSVMSRRSDSSSKKNFSNNSTTKLDNSPQVLKTSVLIDKKESLDKEKNVESNINNAKSEVMDILSNKNTPKKDSKRDSIENAVIQVQEKKSQQIKSPLKKNSLEASPISNKVSVESKTPLLDEIFSQKSTAKKSSSETVTNSTKNSVEKAKLANMDLITKHSITPEISSPDKKILETIESYSQKSTPNKTIELFQENKEKNSQEYKKDDAIENENYYDIELENNLKAKIQPKSEFPDIKEESPQKEKLSEKKIRSWCLIFKSKLFF